eukprot:4485247-Prymnesium_polylepis.2
MIDPSKPRNMLMNLTPTAGGHAAACLFVGTDGTELYRSSQVHCGLWIYIDHCARSYSRETAHNCGARSNCRDGGKLHARENCDVRLCVLNHQYSPKCLRT